MVCALWALLACALFVVQSALSACAACALCSALKQLGLVQPDNVRFEPKAVQAVEPNVLALER